MSHFSRSGRYIIFNNGKFTLDMTFIFLFTIAVIVNVLTLTTLQNSQGQLYNISILQMILGMSGFVLLIPVLSRINFKLNSSWEETKNWVLVGSIAFVLVRLLSNIFGSATGYNNLTIVTTSAIFEEALFLPLALILYIMMSPIINNISSDVTLNRLLLIIFVAVVTGLFFALLHLGVYGSDYNILLSLMVARMIFTVAFLYSRNFMTSTFAHLINNVSIAILFL